MDLKEKLDRTQAFYEHWVPGAKQYFQWTKQVSFFFALLVVILAILILLGILALELRLAFGG